jgi:hypothetical protein
MVKSVLDAEMEKLENAMLGGKGYQPEGIVKKVPEVITNYIKQHKEQILGYKTLPYFDTDITEITMPILKRGN